MKNLLAILFLLLSLTAQAVDLPGLNYQGCFVCEETPSDRNSDQRIGWSWGVCRVRTFNTSPTEATPVVEGSIEIVSKKQGRSIAPFAIPETLGISIGNAPRVRRSGDWRPAYDLAEVSKHIPAANIEMMGLHGEHIVLNRFYNVGNFHWPAVWKGSIGYTFDREPLFTAGWLVEFPARWQGALGRYAAGANRTGNGHQVPVLYGLDEFLPGETIKTTRLIGPDKWSKIPDSPTACTGATACGDHVYFIGFEGLGKGWYGMQAETIDGTTYRDPLRKNKGYHAEGYRLRIGSVKCADLAKVRICGADPEVVPVEWTSLTGLVPDNTMPDMLKAGICSDGDRVFATVPYMVQGAREPVPVVFMWGRE